MGRRGKHLIDPIMDIQSVVLDTSLLCRPADRRFVMAAWERLGQTVPVLPRVVAELYGVMAEDERKHWTRVLEGEERRGQAAYSVEDRYLIGEAVMAGIHEWIRKELDVQVATGQSRDNSALRVVLMDTPRAAQAAEIADRIPAYCFRGHGGAEGHRGDRSIIGQAVVMGYTVLASQNFSSIRAHRLNDWVKEEHGLRTDLIQDPDKVVLELHKAVAQDPDAEALKAVLLATLPDRRVSPEREDQIVDVFLSRLSGFSDTADGARQVWEGEQGGLLSEQIRGELSGSLARATEKRRITTVRAFAREAGWAQPTP